MPLIVNLSTLHQYSFNKTVSAFVNICDEQSDMWFMFMPFQRLVNYLWVMGAYYQNKTTLIDRYKLGQMSSEEFINGLADIFDFLPRENKEKLGKAWSSSIGFNAFSKQKFDKVLEQSTFKPVYLVSNTNELDITAVLDQLREAYPDRIHKDIDVSIISDKQPIEIMDNVFLCLSYRYQVFKNQTSGLIEKISENLESSPILVSNHVADLQMGAALGFEHCLSENQYFGSALHAYIQQRNHESELFSTRYLLNFFGFNVTPYRAKIKISAAQKVLDNIDDLTNLKNELTVDEWLALRDGRLNKIIQELEIDLYRTPQSAMSNDLQSGLNM